MKICNEGYFFRCLRKYAQADKAYIRQRYGKRRRWRYWVRRRKYWKDEADKIIHPGSGMFLTHTGMRVLSRNLNDQGG